MFKPKASLAIESHPKIEMSEGGAPKFKGPRMLGAVKPSKMGASDKLSAMQRRVVKNG